MLALELPGMVEAALSNDVPLTLERIHAGEVITGIPALGKKEATQ